MKLLNTEQTNWDENIKLELTLRELQIIRDSIGATSYNDKKYIWDKNGAECPYNLDQNKILFNDVMSILKKQGGVTFE